MFGDIFLYWFRILFYNFLFYNIKFISTFVISIELENSVQYSSVHIYVEKLLIKYLNNGSTL